MLLPRALAVRKPKIDSSAADHPSAQSARPNQDIFPVDSKPQEPETSAKQRITPPITQHDTGTVTRSTLTLPTPNYYSSSSRSLSSFNVTKSYPHQASQEKLIRKSPHTGCIVWLNGLPIIQEITKPVITKLVEAIRNKKLHDKPTDHLAESCVVKYVDFAKGLPNCHIRFASASLANQFVQSFKSFSESQNPVVLAISGLEIDCSRLEALVISGRREEIYLDKIPDYLHRSTSET
ncbi:hypothetical protein PTTG_25129 [Puccinia triticina 1-1 BBBD Race 1]|uniref:XRRM domain-containing protein n=2 Tax=Puccinia triticina TaxID=208348 RepID=A0A180H617_PUCT1|nr:uncharacterized protein PtA15_9A260 [Puccinia triticina]OAV99989.1 hypothetical protein PTTG_25129 [Puccinia triticina 1-1 BBBD Race 1]WAQ88135.1 hypothetical protein PtA15_9A260 [Puccinia triticina]